MACINLYKMNFNKVDDFLDDLKSSNYLAAFVNKKLSHLANKKVSQL